MYKHDTEDAKSNNNEFTLQRDYNGQDIVLYFDTIMLAPRHYRDAELCFCLQKDGVVMTDPKPRLVKMKGLSPDFEEPTKQRLAFNYSHTLLSLNSPTNLIIEVRYSDLSN